MSETTTENHLEDFEGGHVAQDENCSAGWCGCWSYPKRCKCGGLIHANFVDENWDSVILEYRCDGCGSTDGPD